MKTKFLIIIVGLIISSSFIFVAIWNSIPEECDEQCEIEKRRIGAGKQIPDTTNSDFESKHVEITGIIDHWQPIDGPSYSLVTDEFVNAKVSVKGIFLYGDTLRPYMKDKAVIIKGLLVSDYEKYKDSLGLRLFGGDPDTATILVDEIQIHHTSKLSKIEEMLLQNQVNYIPNKLVLSKSATYAGGDPACGAVVDADSQTHWFKVDSMSEPKNMTLYSENPQPCKINHTTCFCSAQTKLTEKTIGELSYLGVLEEEEIGKRVKTYFETIPHQIPVTEFVVGKYNLDLGEQYDEICGILLDKDYSEEKFNDEYYVYKYFSAAKEEHNLWDFSISVNSESLCAIHNDARIFEYEKSGE